MATVFPLGCHAFKNSVADWITGIGFSKDACLDYDNPKHLNFL